MEHRAFCSASLLHSGRLWLLLMPKLAWRTFCEGLDAYFIELHSKALPPRVHRVFYSGRARDTVDMLCYKQHNT